MVSAEFQEAFGEHAFDEEGNYLGIETEGEPAEAAEDFGDEAEAAETYEAVAPA